MAGHLRLKWFSGKMVLIVSASCATAVLMWVRIVVNVGEIMYRSRAN